MNGRSGSGRGHERSPRPRRSSGRRAATVAPFGGVLHQVSDRPLELLSVSPDRRHLGVEREREAREATLGSLDDALGKLVKADLFEMELALAAAVVAAIYPERTSAVVLFDALPSSRSIVPMLFAIVDLLRRSATHRRRKPRKGYETTHRGRSRGSDW